MGERQGQVERAPPPWRCPLPPHNGPSSLRSSAGRPPAEALAQASALRLSFPTCITGEQVVVTRKNEGSVLSIHVVPWVSSSRFYKQGSLPSYCPVLPRVTKPALPLAPGPAEPGLQQSPRVRSPGGATAFSALITGSWELGPKQLPYLPATPSPSGLNAFLIPAFPSGLRLLKWSNVA